MQHLIQKPIPGLRQMTPDELNRFAETMKKLIHSTGEHFSKWAHGDVRTMLGPNPDLPGVIAKTLPQADLLHTVAEKAYSTPKKRFVSELP